MEYEEKPAVVKALQWNGTADRAEDILNMLQQTERGFVRAVSIKMVEQIGQSRNWDNYLEVEHRDPNNGDVLTTKIWPQDWVVLFPNDEFQAWGDRLFQNTYQPKETT